MYPSRRAAGAAAGVPGPQREDPCTHRGHAGYGTKPAWSGPSTQVTAQRAGPAASVASPRWEGPLHPASTKHGRFSGGSDRAGS